MCKSRTGVRLGKFPMVRRTLFCRRCNFSMMLAKVKVTLRLTVSQSVSLGVILFFHTYGLVFVGRLLWWEDGSVFWICCWPSPAWSFSGPSPLGLVTIFYCLRFETSLFVASYDSHGHGGGIRPHHHRGVMLACRRSAYLYFCRWAAR
jgi:hypothetical protein